MIRSARAASRVDLGFQPDNVLIGSFDVALRRYDERQSTRFYDELLRRVRAIPGVRSAALASTVPLGYSHNSANVFLDEPRPGMPEGGTSVLQNIVSGDYFATMGIRLQAGREFTAHDDSTAPRVAIVNAAMASRLWPDRQALGQRFRLKAGGPFVEVVGVVPTGKYVFVSDGARPLMYLPAAQHYRPARTIHLRVAHDEAAAVPALRSVVSQLDPELPMYDVRSMREHLRLGFAFIFLRIGAALALAFGVLGLVEAVVGLYGVVSYSVAQRTREIGIRVALGARPSDVLRDVVQQGLVMTVAGLAIGAGLAVLVTRPLQNLLIGVAATDIASYAIAAALLSGFALIASLVPAWRAARLPPVTALRAEQ
jgi:predicted permease